MATNNPSSGERAAIAHIAAMANKAAPTRNAAPRHNAAAPHVAALRAEPGRVKAAELLKTYGAEGVVWYTQGRTETEIAAIWPIRQTQAGGRLLAIPTRTLGGPELAHVLNTTTHNVMTMERLGQLPPPVAGGPATRWGAEAIATWLAAGCPHPTRGEAQQHIADRAAGLQVMPHLR